MPDRVYDPKEMAKIRESLFRFGYCSRYGKWILTAGPEDWILAAELE
jgi:hypothetical protein